jgi:hypothetical protein
MIYSLKFYKPIPQGLFTVPLNLSADEFEITKNVCDCICCGLVRDIANIC